MTIAIIGAGLAGTACAYALKRAGLSPHIYEAGNDIAGGASGNPLGLVNPRLSADRTPESDFYASAFTGAVREFDLLQPDTDIGWRKCGGLHLIVEDKKSRRFPQTLENWAWPEEHMQLVNAGEASAIAGIDLGYEALYLPDSGYVSPEKLCRFYAQGVPVTFSAPIQNIFEVKADAIILACGAAVTMFTEAAWLPIGNVRGQITEIEATDASSKIRCNIGYGGYIAPAANGKHILGATFQRWLDHADILPEDDIENIKHLQTVIPALDGPFTVKGHRASMRAAAKDHFPIIGRLPGYDNIYLSTAHGSHGIVTSLAGAELLADMIAGRPYSHSRYSVNALAPDRFQ